MFAGLSGGVMITSLFCTKSARPVTPTLSLTSSMYVPLAEANTSAVPSDSIEAARSPDDPKLNVTVVPAFAASKSVPDLRERGGQRRRREDGQLDRLRAALGEPSPSPDESSELAGGERAAEPQIASATSDRVNRIENLPCRCGRIEVRTHGRKENQLAHRKPSYRCLL